MPVDFRKDYEVFGGQLIKQTLSDGTRLKNARLGNVGSPEKHSGSLYPYMPKCTQMLFDMPKVEVNPFERLVETHSAEYGSYIELAAIGDPNYDPEGETPSRGANIPLRTQGEACMVYDRISYTANYLFMNVFTNYAYIEQTRGMKQYVTGGEGVSKLAGMIQQSAAQELSIRRKAILSRLFSDCVPGINDRNATMNSKSNYTGVSVTDDDITVGGWAGRVIVMDDIVIPELEFGDEAEGIDAEFGFKLGKSIRNTLTHGKWLNNYYVPNNNRLDKFDKPVLVMEESVLDALNDSFIASDITVGGDVTPRVYNMDWSDYVQKGKSVDILTVDKFDPLPIGTATEDKRLLCAIVEPDMFKNFVYSDDMQSDICIHQRGVVYDYQRVEAIGVDVRRPSAVFLCPSDGDDGNGGGGGGGE